MRAVSGRAAGRTGSQGLSADAVTGARPPPACRAPALTVPPRPLDPHSDDDHRAPRQDRLRRTLSRARRRPARSQASPPDSGRPAPAPCGIAPCTHLHPPPYTAPTHPAPDFFSTPPHPHHSIHTQPCFGPTPPGQAPSRAPARSTCALDAHGPSPAAALPSSVPCDCTANAAACPAFWGGMA